VRRPVGRIAFTVLAAVMLALGAVRVRAAALVGVVVGLAYVLSWRRADVRTLSTPTQGRLDTPQVATVRELSVARRARGSGSPQEWPGEYDDRV
jgi:hypothetical protein